MKNLGKTVLFILSVSFIAIFTYRYLPSTFFQQDEWSTFGRFIYLEKTGGLWDILLYPFFMGKGHFLPLPFYQTYVELRLFGLSFPFFAYVSIFTHIINGILLFYFVQSFTKKQLLAMGVSFIFLANSISSQSIIWFSASPNTQGAVLFLLLSLIFIVKYLQGSRIRNYYIGLALFSVGVFFKETILFFFILAPLMWRLFAAEKVRKNFRFFLKPLILLGVAYFLIRVCLFFIPSPIAFNASNTVNFSITSNIVNLLTLPFRILPQALIPQSFLIQLSNQAILIFFPQYVLTDGSVNPFISQTIIFDKVVYLLSAITITLGVFVYKLFIWKGEKILAKAVIFSFIFIMLSSMPFAFIPGNAGNFSIFEPRDLHVASLGISLFTVLSIYGLARLATSNRKYIFIAALVILFPLMLMHVKLTRAEIYKIIGMSQDRKSILSAITTQYPLLSKRTIFYIQSNKAYYGLPDEEKIPPFQSGFGQTLLVWYSFHNNKVPVCFFEKGWLYDLLEQGYKNCEERGFGYFRSYGALAAAVKKYSVPVSDVIAFSWDDGSNNLINITDPVRIKLGKEL